MPKVILSGRQIEWKFANALSKFFHPRLMLGADLIQYPFVQEKGFLGYLKGGIATFSGDSKVQIKDGYWTPYILEAIRKYEEECGITVEVETED